MSNAMDRPKEPSSTQPRESHKTASLANHEHVSPEMASKKKHTLSQETLEARHARYERMVRELYRYQLGTISFLDLLSSWEQQLGILSQAQKNQKREKECTSTTKGDALSPFTAG